MAQGYLSKDSAAPPKLSEIFLCVIIIARVAILLGLTGMLDVSFFPYPASPAGGKSLLAFEFLFWIEYCAVAIWAAKANRCLADRVQFGLTIGQALAGFGFLVPVLPLWQPYFTLREIYKASRSPKTWLSDKQTAIIGWWWGISLAAGMLGFAVLAFSHQMADNLPWFDVVLRGLLLAKLVLLLIIVVRVGWWLQHGGARPNVENLF